MEAGHYTFKHKRDILIVGFDWRWVEFPALIKWMRKLGGPHYIEGKASGKSAKQTLQSHGLSAIEVSLQGGDKIARAELASPIPESGRVYCLAHILERLMNDDRQGLKYFPTGTHDDLNDAYVQMLNRLGGRRQFLISKKR